MKTLLELVDVRDPHGDGGPDRHTSELYDLVSDPGERRNLIDDPNLAPLAESLRSELDRLISEAGGVSSRRYANSSSEFVYGGS